MTGKRPRIAVIGAGAIGGVTAGLLARAGHDVEIVCKHQETVDRIRSRGLRVGGLAGEYCANIVAAKDIADITGEKDLVLIATKANDARDAARQSHSFLAEDALVVPLQNGIVEDDVAQTVGARRVVGCVVGWSATMVAPAEVVYTRAAEFIVGDLFGLEEKKVARVAGILNDAVATRISGNIRGELYSKLILNCCINALSAVTGLNVGPLLDLKRARDLFVSIMEEAVEVADALGITLVPALGGLLDYHAFLTGSDEAACGKRDDVLVLMGRQAWDVKPSSVQSLERGKPTETPWLNGYIVAQAARVGVLVPVNQGIVHLIDRIERQALSMTPENLKHPLLTRFDT